MEQICATNGNFQEDISENEDEEHPQNESEEVNAKGRTIGGMERRQLEEPFLQYR